MGAVISYYIRGNNKLRFAQAVGCWPSGGGE